MSGVSSFLMCVFVFVCVLFFYSMFGTHFFLSFIFIGCLGLSNINIVPFSRLDVRALCLNLIFLTWKLCETVWAKINLIDIDDGNDGDD